jgi:hypothetical protein
LTTFSATGRAWFESVVRRTFRRVSAAIPYSRIRFATVLTQQGVRRATSSAWIRGRP